MSLADIPTALTALRAGRPIIVADDEARENEGDVVLAAESASQEWVAWAVRNSSGFICAPMTNELADRLVLPPMVTVNEDPRGTAYTVSVDAADRAQHGHQRIRPRPHPPRARRPDLDAAEPRPARPHPAASGRGRGRPRARRAHRGGRRPPQTRRAHPRRGDRRDRRRGRRDDAPARADRARRARRRAGDHHREPDPLHGGATLRVGPGGGRRRPGVHPGHLRGRDHGSDGARHVPVRAYRDRSTGADHVAWISENPPTARSSACTPSA